MKDIRQRNYLILILGSSAGFFMSISELLMKHDNWGFISSPIGVGHIFLLLGTYITSIGASLKFQIPRDEYTHSDRVSDK